MADTAGAPEQPPREEGGATVVRSDALASRQRIIRAAAMLEGDRRVTMAELAAAAGVGRSVAGRLDAPPPVPHCPGSPGC